MNRVPKITVCVPTYNRFKDLENLIVSFLEQDFENAELLIIDDLGSVKIGEVAKKWIKKSNKIIYHKNTKNLGYPNNMRQAFKLATGEIIVFMGDDDLFIDNSALSYFAKAFEDKKVGVAKASQILYKIGKVNQAFPLKRDKGEIIFYKNGNETFENIWFESISVSGLAFRNDKETKELVSEDITLYPQVELMGLVCLKHYSAEINKHLIGVQSHSGQLQCISYIVDGVRTNILKDWLEVYDRINKFALKNKLKFISKKRFMEKLTLFTLFFLPYSSLTNGRIETVRFILEIVRNNHEIMATPFFFVSCLISLFFPKRLIILFTETVKKLRLYKILPEDKVAKYNILLEKYYTI
jgi:glycosyltransferase involved in cell wall biosynthesis